MHRQASPSYNQLLAHSRSPSVRHGYSPPIWKSRMLRWWWRWDGSHSTTNSFSHLLANWFTEFFIPLFPPQIQTLSSRIAALKADHMAQSHTITELTQQRRDLALEMAHAATEMSNLAKENESLKDTVQRVSGECQTFAQRHRRMSVDGDRVRAMLDSERWVRRSMGEVMRAVLGEKVRFVY